jgi:prepilin-type N-terminal cleavage/methylation domain-containing protein
MKSNRTQSQKRKQRGFTLTEIAIVLGIVGLILGAIWVAAGAVYTNLRVSSTSRDMLAMAQGIRTLYTNQGLMDAGFTTVNLIASGVAPGDMVNTATNTLSDAWGGAITFTPATTINTAGDSFVVDLSGVPTGACVSLLSTNSSPATGTGIAGLNAGAALFNTAASIKNGGNYVTNYTATAAVAACSAAAIVHVGYLFSVH